MKEVVHGQTWTWDICTSAKVTGGSTSVKCAATNLVALRQVLQYFTPTPSRARWHMPFLHISPCMSVYLKKKVLNKKVGCVSQNFIEILAYILNTHFCEEAHHCLSIPGSIKGVPHRACKCYVTAPQPAWQPAKLVLNKDSVPYKSMLRNCRLTEKQPRTCPIPEISWYVTH